VAIQEIWNAKKLYEQEKQAPIHLQDFLYTHLVRYDCYHQAHGQIIILLSCASCTQLSIAQPCMRHTVGFTELPSLCVLCTTVYRLSAVPGTQLEHPEVPPLQITC